MLWLPVRVAHATPTVINSIALLTGSGTLTGQLAPRDTFFVDITMTDANGFLDITSVELMFFYGDLSTNPGGPALRATYVWVQGTPQSYTLQEPVPSTWQIIPSLSTQTAFTNTNRPRTVRMAIVPGIVARASMGGWGMRVKVFQNADPVPSEAVVTGLFMASRFSFGDVSSFAQFSPGLNGARRLPLVNPADGGVHVGLVTNTPLHLQGSGSDLVGVTDTTLRIAMGPPGFPIGWHVPGATDTVGLDTTMADVIPDLAENVDESPQTRNIELFLSIPQNTSPQDYAGGFRLRLRSSEGVVADTAVATRATVVAGGLAAETAVAEILPHTVTAGATHQEFSAYLLPTFGTGTTGINRVRISLPSGFSDSNVLEVRVGGSSVAFVSNPSAGYVVVGLPRVWTPESVQIRFTTTVTTTATAAAAFPVFYDDTTTSGPEQVATEGDADSIADGDNWQVQVVPGPLARLDVSPGTATLTIGETRKFTAGGSDGFGNHVPTSVGWRAEGGMGTIDSSGVFSATAAGSGIVIAESGGVADTGFVTVNEPPVAMTADAALQNDRTLIPGAPPVELFRFRITNRSANAETLVTASFESSGVGAGTQAQRDSCWSPLTLGVVATGSAAAVDVAQATVVDGIAAFAGLDVPIPADSAVSIIVRGGASLFARDGDVLDLRLVQAGDVQFRSGIEVSGYFPLDPAGDFPIDGMSAAQIRLTPVQEPVMRIGSRRNLGLQIRVPANGYQADRLRRISVVNLGTAVPGQDIAAMEAWLDDGDAAFDPARDTRLGPITFTGDRWELTGISTSVPFGGISVFITVDVTDVANEGRTIRLGLPSLPDPGLGMESSNTGPVDTGVINPAEQVTSAVDRVSLAAADVAPGRVLPDAKDVLLLKLVAGNTYGTSRHMSGLIVTNSTVGTGSSAQRDAEVARVRLRLDDGDGVLEDAASDSVLSTSGFVGGRAVFEGFDWALPPGQSRTLFVTADLAAAGATDGDSIAAQVERSVDVTFDSSTTVGAHWPVTSNARWGIDGMIASQLTMHPSFPFTYGPGDSLEPVLDFIVPRNGYANDILHGISLVNLGTASQGDIEELRLWRDDGDGAFQSTTDQDLGPLTFFNGVWRSPYLSQPLDQAGARLFVTLSVSDAPRDSSTLLLEVPVDGVVTESNNRGPIDHSVWSSATQLISSAPLLSSISVDRSASTVGARVSVRLTVRNRGGESVTDVRPVLDLDGASTGAASYVTGPAPSSADIDPGASATFTWTYQSTSRGEVMWLGSAAGLGATSGLVRRSLSVASNPHQIYTEADSLACFAVQSMPFAVRRGQTDVVPLSLTFSNDGLEGSSDVRLLGLELRIESSAGNGVVPADVLSRIAVREGSTVYLSKTGLETSGSDVDMTLTTPIRITRGEPVTVALELDVSPTTTTTSFRVIVVDSTMFRAEDATSGTPVQVLLKNQTYPIRSGLASVVAPATELEFTVADTAASRANRGASDVELHGMQLVNPGIAGLSPNVRLGSLALGLIDSLGHTVADASTRLSRLRLIGPFSQVADVVVPTDSVIHVVLAPPLDVPLNTPIRLHVRGDIAAAAELGSFRVVVRDSASVDARDANTGEPVPPRFNGPMLAGPMVQIELPATAITLRGVAQFPATLPVGRTAVAAFTATLHHPGTEQVAGIRVDSVSVRVQDERRRPQPAGSFLDRVHVLWNDVEVATISDPSPTSGVVGAHLGVPLNPGATGRLSIVVDLQATASQQFMEIVLDADAVNARDVNSGGAVAVVADSDAILPVTSGLTRLEPPARILTVDFSDKLSPVMPSDGAEVVVGQVVLTNAAAAGSGTIAVRSIALEAADRGFGAMPIGRLASEVRAYRQGVLWGTSGPLPPDSMLATVVGTDTLDIGTSSPQSLEIRMFPRLGGADGAFRLGMDGSGIGVVQPQSTLLSVAVLGIAGRSFPMWTQTAAFTPRSLAASYSNFPNPFAAGREETHFTFNLPSPGQVDLVIWTGRGNRVATLMSGVPLSAGLHQSTAWDGRNGRGAVVVNGAYIAELVARLDSGERERLLRKIMVVR